MKLYYAPQACSLSPQIALQEAGLAYEPIRVDMGRKALPDGSDYKKVSPKGYVPALILDDGNLLTEGAVMIQYIADLAPAKGLAPRQGTFERVRLQEWLNFIATELHKGMSPFYNKDVNDAYKSFIHERLQLRMQVLAEGLDSKPFLMGEHFTVADGYGFYIVRSWDRVVKRELPQNLIAWRDRIAARPAVKKALEIEGLS